MKNTLSSVWLCILIITIYSCRKDSAHQSTPPDPQKPDFSTKIATSLSGYVQDEDGAPIPFAKVTAGDKLVNTDQYGYYSFDNVSLPQTAGLIKVSASGFFMACKTIIPQKDKNLFTRIGLLKKPIAITIDAAAGGEAATTEGAKITLPANGVVQTATGTAYTGQVQVSLRWLDPAATGELPLGLPGDDRGTTTDGYLKGLRSYGILLVDLTDAGGQPLEIAPGSTADISIPISDALTAAAPATIDLWSLNDTTGLWRQEGKAKKTGSSYAGKTSHFSFWDGAEAVDLVNLKARIVDASSNPLAHVPVSVTQANLPQNAGYGRFGFTDEDGNVTGAVYANSNLVIQVLTPCAIQAYAHPFTTSANDIDLGQLTGNLGQNQVTLTGSVLNCSNSPVTDGYVQTYDHGFYNRIPVVNGQFSFTGTACTNLPVNIVAIDNGALQQGDPQSLTLTAGLNSLGVLTACGTSTVGSIHYTLDGVSSDIIEPADTVAAYFLTIDAANDAANWTQIVTLSGNPNAHQQMAFQFDGGKSIGSSHTLTEVYCYKFSTGRAYWPTPITLTISEYGPIGGFVSGSFSSQLIDFDNSGAHTFSCNFRVRRYN